MYTIKDSEFSAVTCLTCKKPMEAVKIMENIKRCIYVHQITCKDLRVKNYQFFLC